MDRLIEFAFNHYILSSSFVALLVAWFVLEKKRAGATVTPQQATMLLNRDEAVFVDIRDKKDFSEGHIKGSVHIPLASLKDRVTELEKYKEKKIVLVDKLGQHTGMAGKQLRAAGYEQILRLQGGIAEWRSSNFPVSKK